jgi:hypothetical protein
MAMATRRIRWAASWKHRAFEQQALRYERLAVRLFTLADALNKAGRDHQARTFREAGYRFRVHALCCSALAAAYDVAGQRSPSQRSTL